MPFSATRAVEGHVSHASCSMLQDTVERMMKGRGAEREAPVAAPYAAQDGWGGVFSAGEVSSAPPPPAGGEACGRCREELVEGGVLACSWCETRTCTQCGVRCSSCGDGVCASCVQSRYESSVTYSFCVTCAWLFGGFACTRYLLFLPLFQTPQPTQAPGTTTAQRRTRGAQCSRTAPRENGAGAPRRRRRGPGAAARRDARRSGGPRGRDCNTLYIVS